MQVTYTPYYVSNMVGHLSFTHVREGVAVKEREALPLFAEFVA